MIRQRNSLVGSLFARSRAMPVLLIHWIIVKYFTQGVKELWRIGWMLQLMVLWFLRRRSGVKCILVFTTLILDLFIPFSANYLLYFSEIHATADCSSKADYMKSWLHRRSIFNFKAFRINIFWISENEIFTRDLCINDIWSCLWTNQRHSNQPKSLLQKSSLPIKWPFRVDIAKKTRFEWI